MSSCAEAGEVLTSVRELFAAINRDPNLTEGAKRRMKGFYLEELITPKARTLLHTHCPDEFKEFDLRTNSRRRKKIWVDPSSHALAFLRKDKTSAS